MTQREVAQYIAKNGHCVAISCRPQDGLRSKNPEACPLHHGLFDCHGADTIDEIKKRASQWLMNDDIDNPTPAEQEETEDE